ncbi:Stage 0 sporulation protein KA,oligopeptide ABC transporter substrate-binding protein OppA,ABC-type oligopeptide transport system, periplasmic component,nickel ABC transporter, nickel/metallophore periplasmic binding protein,Bacterial extracellular solute-binding proteins, family 5 Middle [Chlamydia serpentis]|uniref:Solute-binding protein family 5 domain-containing protein n=1 Tax=Chlamydia serpentis TaxID=1967782 RepID=A0A2R8FA97_9CHLA|nr:ABC transporter substrate-binding protein [Chlamydia serpentis]SPN73353.1 Stage 0 sporulation protein KA,oligopeptide ABC transporter substrate-binding protein OppA,ABC-type oligopeptide transport system, periplasmic component,nickel ABC transporter, nickel/metallophore periplasmic binding protein,Bacterial extracellular solute-binding proteins, family 5 Middle [Chlamydia serpentis]
MFLRWVSLFLLITSLTGCLPYSAKHKQSLTIAIHDDPIAFSPEQAKRSMDLSIAKLLFDGLTRETPTGSNGLELAIASRYTVTEDFSSYTFYIKDSALWSDGTPITSEDIRNAWEYSQEHSPHTKVFEGLHFYTPSVNAINIVLESPNADFPKLLTFPAFAIFKPRNSKIFSGPYTLIEYSPGNSLFLKKNPNYYDYHYVSINSITLLIIPDIYTAIHLLNRGKIDWVGQPWHQGIPWELHRQTQYYYHSYPVEGAFWLTLNTKSPHLKNLQNRHRLATSIDKRSLIQEALQGSQEPAETLSRGMPQPNQYNKEKPLTPPEKLVLTYPSDIFRCQRIAEILKEQWKAAGIDLILEGLEYHLFVNKRKVQDYVIATQTGVAYYPGANLMPEEHKLLHNFEIIPLYYMSYDYLTQCSIEGLIYNASGAVDLKYTYLP